MSDLAMTYFAVLRETRGQRRPCSWSALCRWLSTPVVSADKHDVGGFSMATYSGDRRAKGNVELVYAVGLDFDHDVDLAQLGQRFGATQSFTHTTWSSTIDVPRARVFLALSRPVTGPEYERVWTACAQIAGLTVDSAARDASRFWFRPSLSAVGKPFIYWSSVGAPVNVEGALAAVPPPPPPPPPTPRPLTTGGASAFDRARAYLANVPGAISGSNGSTATLMAAVRLVKGFCLSVDDAMVLMREWNCTCQPPWDEKDLLRKVEHAATRGQMAEGKLLDQERAR